MDNNFRKAILSNGCIVQLRDGSKYLLLKDVYNSDVRYYEDLLINLNFDSYLPLSNYNENLKDKCGDTRDDIIKICDMNFVGDNFKKHIINKEDYWTAERDENKEEGLKEIMEEIRIKTEELNEIMKRYEELKDKEVE